MPKKTKPLFFDFLIDASFQGVNRLFVLLFENEVDRTVHTRHYLPKVKIKDYIVMIDGKMYFDQPVKNNLNTYENIWNIWKITQLVLNPYFKEHYKIISIGLSKQQALDADPKAIQQINFTGNLD